MRDKKKVAELIAKLKTQMTTDEEIKLIEEFEFQLNEEWRDVEGYEGLYKVSNMGRIKSLRYGKENILTPQVMRKGYLYIGLSKDKKHKKFLIHILVAKAFIPNPENKNEVNHKFGNKQDNRACALEWVTSSENIRHAYQNGLIKLGSQRNNAKLSDEDVNFIRTNYKFRDKEHNTVELAKKFNVSKCTVHKVVQGKLYKVLEN